MGQLRQFLKLWNTTIICETVSLKCGTVRKSGTSPQKVEQVLSLYHCLIWYKYIAAIWNHNVHMMIYYNVIQVDCCFETRNSILFVILLSLFFLHLFHFLRSCSCSTSLGLCSSNFGTELWNSEFLSAHLFHNYAGLLGYCHGFTCQFNNL